VPRAKFSDGAQRARARTGTPGRRRHASLASQPSGGVNGRCRRRQWDVVVVRWCLQGGQLYRVKRGEGNGVHCTGQGSVQEGNVRGGGYRRDHWQPWWPASWC
jgi:hypothetical protein